MVIENPILPGFTPDPSICQVGNDYYLVNSSFAYFPALPLWHSRDLKHWDSLGTVLNRPEQLPLSGLGVSEGLYAPTIRYHNGLFYIICTLVPHPGNFIVTASNPAGSWSAPHWLNNAEGIDPSLFFDSDGRCYCTGTRSRSTGSTYFGDQEIWCQELDLNTLTLIGTPQPIWYGAFRHSVWAEGPHLYWKDGWYYLLHAEGGTERHHAMMIARSRSVFGVYEGCPDNPILTHRHLGQQYPITCVGHGDLFQKDGLWYLVALACRPVDGVTLLGRETFLAPVIWEDDWPVVCPGTGVLPQQIQVPWDACPISNTAEPKPISLRGIPRSESAAQNGWQRLFASPERLDSRVPSYLGLRLTSVQTTLHLLLEVHVSFDGECGLLLMQNEHNHLRLSCSNDTLRLIQTEQGVETVLVCTPYAPGAPLELHLNGRTGTALDTDCDLGFLSTEQAGGFVGCTWGVYLRSGNPADFVDFSMQQTEDAM